MTSELFAALVVFVVLGFFVFSVLFVAIFILIGIANGAIRLLRWLADDLQP